MLLFYRKILNDLSSEDTRDRKDESNAVVTSVPVTTPLYQTSTGQYSMYYLINFYTGRLLAPMILIKNYNPFQNYLLSEKQSNNFGNVFNSIIIYYELKIVFFFIVNIYSFKACNPTSQL